MANGYSVPVPQGAPYRPSAPSRPETIAEVFNRTIEENVRRFGGPHLSAALFGSQAGDLGAGQPARGGIVPGMAELSPGADVRDLLQGGGQFMRGTANLSPTDLLGGAGLMGAATLGMAIPGSAGGVRQAVNEVAEEVAPQGIRAYHGSPHSFDEFSTENIGTGEGAQAYGHGLYFAENEDVARNYRDAIMRNEDQLVSVAKKHGLTDDAANLLANQSAMGFGGKRFNDWARSLESVADDPFSSDRVKGAAKEITEKLVEASDAYREMRSSSMYEVNIRANPEDFLDWDKPLSEQSETVRGAVLSTLPENEFIKAGGGPAGSWAYYKKNEPGFAEKFTGADLQQFGKYADSAGMGVDPVALASALKDAGIPGIRYLDQGSRVRSRLPWTVNSKRGLPLQNFKTKQEAIDFAGGDASSVVPTPNEGSRNYVTFSDDIVEILRKYGIVAPVAGGAAAGLMGGSGEAEAEPIGPYAASRPAL